MRRALLICGAILGFASTAGLASDRIEGRWRTEPGATAAISSCGEAFCITLKDGEYAGKQVGRFEATGDGTYVGSVTNPEDGATYNGKGRLKGESLAMSGCVLGGLVCKSQTWRKL